MISRTSAAAWWCSPVASILLVVSGIVIVFWEVWLGERAQPLGYSAGIALIGLGVTGRIQSWAFGSRPNGSPPEKEPNGG